MAIEQFFSGTVIQICDLPQFPIKGARKVVLSTFTGPEYFCIFQKDARLQSGELSPRDHIGVFYNEIGIHSIELLHRPPEYKPQTT